MNFNLTDNPFTQIAQIWKGFRPIQRASIITISLLTLALCSYLVIKNLGPTYIPLFSSNRTYSSADMVEIKSHLDHLQIPYTIQPDNMIMVRSDQAYRARLDLAASGFPKLPTENKGFELFDSGTWIKGEKELQILELRALKGQLENDISEFDNIRSASVILDIAPPRPFGGTIYKTKASVILNLVPGARISQSELRAITYHISGAVRGLTPNMVAISDTTGRLYQSIDPEGNTDTIRNAELALEEHVKAKIDGLLATVVGFDNYYSSVQIVMSRDKTTEERKVYTGKVDGASLGAPITTKVSESFHDHPGGASPAGKGINALVPLFGQFQESKQQVSPQDTMKISSGPGKIENISIAVLIDQHAVLKKYGNPTGEEAQKDLEKFRQEIENQVNTILKGYQGSIHSAVNFAEFDSARNQMHQTVVGVNVQAPSPGLNQRALTIIGIIAASTLAALLLGYILYSLTRRRETSERYESYKDKHLDLSEKDKMMAILKSRIKDNPDAVASSFQDWLHGKKA